VFREIFRQLAVKVFTEKVGCEEALAVGYVGGGEGHEPPRWFEPMT
jgi:hypothetical protein